jgi:ABC-type nitrate/sulfonate/bicarbonate transport system substrate-binding protein
MVTTQQTGEAPRAGAVDALWYTRCPVPTASSVAIELGWLDAEFAADGIQVTSLRAAPDRAVRESHFDHTMTNSFREGGNTPPLWTRARGGDVRLIGATWVEQYNAVLALPESGIRRPADLRGRRLGIALHVNDQIDFWRARGLRGMLTALEIAGLRPDDAEIVYLPEQETFLGDDDPSRSGSLWSAKHQQRTLRREAFALIRGEVDAIHMTSARGLQLEAFLGAVRVVDLRAAPDPAARISNSAPIVLTASGALVRERPDLVRRYLATVRRAARWAAEHPNEARRIIAADLGDAEEWVQLSYGAALYTALEPSLTDDLVAAVASQRDFLLAHGFIDTDFDVGAWAAPELYA